MFTIIIIIITIITFNVIRLKMLHTYTYKLPVIFNSRLYAMIFVTGEPLIAFIRLTGECRSIYGLETFKVHEKLFFGSESVLVSCMAVWTMVCTSVLITVVVRVPCLFLLGL